MSKAIRKIRNYIGTKTDKIPECSYKSDVITVYPNFIPLATTGYGLGVGGGLGYVVDADSEGVAYSFYIDKYVDNSRKMVITISFTRDDANNDAFDYFFSLIKQICDGSGDDEAVIGEFVESPACAQGKSQKYQYILALGDVDADTRYFGTFYRSAGGGGDARDITIHDITVRYYMKRVLE